MTHCRQRLSTIMVLTLVTTGWVAADDMQVLDIGTRRELFADQYLIDTLARCTARAADPA